jgi:nucleoside-diphosphate-sugar epimerase
MCCHFLEDFGLETRVARYHNVYGPDGTYEGGRERPCRDLSKIIAAQMAGDTEIEVGDGEQRAVYDIDDCLQGTRALMASDVTDPIIAATSSSPSIGWSRLSKRSRARSSSGGEILDAPWACAAGAATIR